jgi:hypothetical protein
MSMNFRQIALSDGKKPARSRSGYLPRREKVPGNLAYRHGYIAATAASLVENDDRTRTGSGLLVKAPADKEHKIILATKYRRRCNQTARCQQPAGLATSAPKVAEDGYKVTVTQRSFDCGLKRRYYLPV